MPTDFSELLSRGIIRPPTELKPESHRVTPEEATSWITTQEERPLGAAAYSENFNDGVSLVNIRQQEHQADPEFDYRESFAKIKKGDINTKYQMEGWERYKALLATGGDYYRIQGTKSGQNAYLGSDETRFYGPDILASLAFHTEATRDTVAFEDGSIPLLRCQIPVVDSKPAHHAVVVMPISDAAYIFYELQEAYQITQFPGFSPDSELKRFLNYVATRSAIESPYNLSITNPQGSQNLKNHLKTWAKEFQKGTDSRKSYSQEYNEGIRKAVSYVEKQFGIQVKAVLAYGSLLNKSPRMYPDGITVKSDADFLVIAEAGQSGKTFLGRLHFGTPSMTSGKEIRGSYVAQPFTPKIPHADFEFYSAKELNTYVRNMEDDLTRAMLPDSSGKISDKNAVYTPSTASLQALIENRIVYGEIEGHVDQDTLEKAKQAFLNCSNWTLYHENVSGV